MDAVDSSYFSMTGESPKHSPQSHGHAERAHTEVLERPGASAQAPSGSAKRNKSDNPEIEA